MMQMLGDLTGIGNQAAARQDSMEYMNKEEQERIAEEIPKYSIGRRQTQDNPRLLFLGF